MKKNIFRLFFVFFFFNSIYSQDYQRVDKAVGYYPSSFSSPLELANKIKQDFTSEGDKARAVFTWMALHINYDIETYLNPKPAKSFSYDNELERDFKWHEIRNKEINTVFRKQKAVCSGYSLLYYHLATLVGLQGQIIEGGSKTKFDDIGRKKIAINHTWNAVMIDGTWRLVDVTWGAGEIINENNLWVKKFNPIYFDSNPKIFFAKHMPVSKVWDNKSLDEVFFLKGPLFFDEYFSKEVEIVEPINGVIEVRGNQKINFKIKNRSKNQEIRYATKGDTISVNPNKIDDNLEQFEVDYTKRDGRFIKIYASGSVIAVFKIMPKREQ
ncbi:transglutaminase domain-containing protein [Flavobacterium marginilacus]|uniref:transglutaminase domain-containing protein n=1 Tax=Flavobacterium marginilacus TaxID=3003256 RepID=UPI00248E2F4B|nr:transglutaminase domain-containing protein [Flavobacterium marginilacus]